MTGGCEHPHLWEIQGGDYYACAFARITIAASSSVPSKGLEFHYKDRHRYLEAKKSLPHFAARTTTAARATTAKRGAR